MTRIAHVEEEDAVLALQQAQQSTASEHFLVGRKMTVVGLVTAIARGRKGNSRNHLSVGIRVLIKIDDGKEVRGLVTLVAGPHVKYGVLLITTTMPIPIITITLIPMIMAPLIPIITVALISIVTAMLSESTGHSRCHDREKYKERSKSAFHFFSNRLFKNQ
jgi:hypothetical protein